jgi:uncharacterized protein
MSAEPALRGPIDEMDRPPAPLSHAGGGEARSADRTSQRAEALIRASRTHCRDLHLVQSGLGCHAFVVDGSRLYDVNSATFDVLREAIDAGAGAQALATAGLASREPAVDDTPLTDPPIHALSLAVAQVCNLGCAYCYAREGSFGGAPKAMPIETAKASIDLMLAGKRPGERAHIAFMGGEPLIHRDVVRETTLYAAREADKRGIRLGFAITTNGTLLDETDADFFEVHGFAVTISLDGPQDLHDRLRPYKGGRGSFDRIIRGVAPLLARQRKAQVAARVTVTPQHEDLPAILDDFVRMGFHSVGFSPMLNSPSGREELSRADLARMLEGMVACGIAFERRTVAGERYPFANMLQALREIRRGTHRPYPCGAGAGYLGVSASGDLFACHRFVDDAAGAMGSLATGVDRARRNSWLRDRHVLRQSPCHGCWARFLCGGGCHHETILRERRACDYIRGWLHYCLGAYARLSAAAPALLEESGPEAA